MPVEPLWRGSLLPLGCTAAPKHSTQLALHTRLCGSGAASRPSGSKLPRHRKFSATTKDAPM
nr:hypothetical protein C1892_10440 [Pseudomonas sp. MPBD7-1]